MNALKSTLPSLNIEFYGSKVRDDYNGVPMWFNGNQLRPSIANGSESDFKEEKHCLKQKWRIPQIMPPVA